ncbi:glycoside hydrolase [Mytilinidion resinicola]|uniref:Glycoside hydrolase n=1 Tax=Mytilinidion resinicola TaxID=574789 RepID=A0A6A6Z9A2_9PEZI|nr:glycoside hydrolase [Mytilinidion resinicola]KAF2817610.1 glycoside hydrolase [Mytilinidion resinicola]
MKGFLHKAKDQVQNSLQREPKAPPPVPGKKPSIFGGGTPQGGQPPPPVPGKKPSIFQRDAPQRHQRSAITKPTAHQKDQPSSISIPDAQEVSRYRYHHGANLGSIYVLEKWLHGSMFPPNAAPGRTSELEAVKLWVGQIGLDAARAKFEAHWRTAVSDSDLAWLSKSANCTTLRLPIGYFTLGPSFCQGTPFEPYASVYTDAWSSIQTLITRLWSFRIGVLLDLHALPGGANGGEHSGTNSGKADLWNSASNLNLGQRCAEFLAQQVRDHLTGVVGIQLCNEANWDAPGMYSWYDRCIASISAIDPSIPVVISDGWNLSKALDYVGKKNVAYPDQPTCPVIVDTHYYWAFSDADKRKSPQAIIAEAKTKMSELDGKEGSVLDRGAFQIIVGEYSCVMTEDSWRKSGGAPKSDLVKQFGQAQSQRYQERSGGSYFWTYKMNWLPGGEWGFIAQSNSATITPPPNLRIADVTRRIANANDKQADLMTVSISAHCGYWDRTAPGKPFEHWRYEQGWKLGFGDASAFLGMNSQPGYSEQYAPGGDKIGNLELWVLKRIRDSGMGGPCVWEFEQGLRAGIKDFYGAAGV